MSGGESGCIQGNILRLFVSCVVVAVVNKFELTSLMGLPFHSAYTKRRKLQIPGG